MKTYIITSYTPGAEIDEDFAMALKSIVKHREAEFIILKTQANHLSDYDSLYEHVFNEEFAKFIATSNIKINDNLTIYAHPQQINVIDPLSGMESTAAKLGCFVMGFPRQCFKTVPRMLRESTMPRAIWCTGAINQPMYKKTKTGLRMKEYHTVGALIIEVVNDKKFNIRQLQFDGRGFYDRKNYYNHNSVDVQDDSVSALVLGDDHALFVNPTVVDATVELLRKLKPQKVIHHDTLDCAAITHWLVSKHLSRAQVDLTLEEEGGITVKYLAKMIKATRKFKAQHYLVASNHPEHLIRYLDEGRYLADTFNHILGLRLALRQAEHKDALDWFLTKYLKKYAKLSRFKCLKRKESFKVHGIELSDHGDYGANGAKPNAKEKGIVYDGQSVTGHTHSPSIGVYGNFVCGTSTYLVLDYTPDAGSSSWLNTHTTVYKNGKRTHEHILLE